MSIGLLLCLFHMFHSCGILFRLKTKSDVIYVDTFSALFYMVPYSVSQATSTLAGQYLGAREVNKLYQMLLLDHYILVFYLS